MKQLANTATIETLDPEYLSAKFGIGNFHGKPYKYAVAFTSDGSFLDIYTTKKAARADAAKYGITVIS